MPFLGFIGRFFRKLFGKDGWLKKVIIPKVIEVVNNVKEWDNTHPEFADLLTMLIPGTWDDSLKLKMREALKFALEQSAQLNSCLAIENEDERIACIIKQIQSITHADTKALVWGNIAAQITKYLANDEKLDINEIAALVKMVYEGTHNEEEDNNDTPEEN